MILHMLEELRFRTGRNRDFGASLDDAMTRGSAFGGLTTAAKKPFMVPKTYPVRLCT